MAVNISELCNMDFRVSFLSVNKTKEYPEKSFVCSKSLRKWDRFFYVSNGRITFETSSGIVSATKGDIVYLPYDVVYTSEWENDKSIGYITIEFILLDTENNRFSLKDNIYIVANDKSGNRFADFMSLYETWVNGEIGYRLKARSQFLDILCKLSVGSLKSDIKSAHNSIYKAILYLENNYIHEVNADELAKMCGMCQSGFRRRFHEYAGMSPIKYKNYLRVKKAAELLETGEYNVSEAAEMVGVLDLAYFNKMFKSFMGRNPKDSKLSAKK